MTLPVEAVLNGLPSPVMVIGLDYRITHANAAMEDLFKTALIGANAVSLFRQAPVLAAIDAAIRDGQIGEARYMMSDVTGEVVYNFCAQPLAETAGAVISLEDHSGLEAAERIRRDFVVNISHELRTPLTSLAGFIETLRGAARDDPDARERFLEIMDSEARRMGRLVSDLMSLSRVEEDARVRPRARVDLSAVLRSVLATLEGKLADANVTVDAQGLDQPHPVLGDRDQLIQLFLNLTENAIKYGGADKVIHLNVKPVPHDVTLRCPAIRVELRDEGPGIDTVHLPRLTERFYRVDTHRSREMGGTGLGLAIVKHIINRHRGRLKIQSEQGVGSTFSTILPSI